MIYFFSNLPTSPLANEQTWINDFFQHISQNKIPVGKVHLKMSVKYISAFMSETLQLLWEEVWAKGETYLKVKTLRFSLYDIKYY